MGRQAKWDSGKSRLTSLNPQVSLSLKKKKKLFIYLAALSLNSSTQDLLSSWRHAGSHFPTRDQTWVSCILGAWSVSHRTTREPPTLKSQVETWGQAQPHLAVQTLARCSGPLPAPRL